MSGQNKGRQGESLLYGLYSLLGWFVHPLLVLAGPVLKRLAPSWQMEERMGNYSSLKRQEKQPLLWIHAASVGEVQVARVLIDALIARRCGCRFFVTTLTSQGRDVARMQFPPGIRCELAPLDTPKAVAGALERVRPDMYICLETELWPLLLSKISKTGIPMLLLNGRMSEGSCRQYQKIPRTMAGLLAGFAGFAVIGEQDRNRYQRIGADERKIKVCGNMKYGLREGNPESVTALYYNILNLEGKRVFLCGSTRSGEEQLLLPVFRRLQKEVGEEMLWIIAPRHLERVTRVIALLNRGGLRYDLFSDCTGRGRKEQVVIIDNMGELARLYSIGDYNFCGGSLVDKGGHNIMEPVRWQKPVYFGPFMKDFQDAVDLVLAAEAGFQVTDAAALAEMIIAHMHDQKTYQQACSAAAELVRSQSEAVRKQADMVMELLAA